MPFISKSDRDNLIEYGLGTENWQKLTSKGDSGASSGDDVKVQDKLKYDTFGTKQRIKLSKILDSIGLFVPHTMMNNLEYIIMLPSSSEVLVTQTGEASIEYTLQNLHLEYETIINEELANEVTGSFFNRKKSSI